MKTQFDDWLDASRNAGCGPHNIPILRGAPFQYGLVIGAPLVGAVLRGSIRQSPDAPVAPLVDFTVTGPVVSGNYTSFILSLTKVQTGLLPPDDDGNGVVHLPYDLMLTPFGGIEMPFLAGLVEIRGKVTNAL